jgi:hypothetical protein
MMLVLFPCYNLMTSCVAVVVKGTEMWVVANGTVLKKEQECLGTIGGY